MGIPLVLSLNFLKDIIKLDQASHLWALYTSWILLGLTIVVSVSAHLFSYDLTEQQIKRVENKQELKEDKLTIRLNYAMAACLILGIAFQIFFVTFNTIAMAEKKKNLNEIKGNTHVTPKEKLIEKSLPYATAPSQLTPKPKPSSTGSKQYSNPVQSPPKAIAKPKNSSDSSSKNK